MSLLSCEILLQISMTFVNSICFLSSPGGIVPKDNQQHLTNSRGKSGKKKGIVGSKMNDKAFWFDAANKKWHELTSMRRGRKNLALVQVDDLIYAIGGMTINGGPLYNVDCYSLTSKEWYVLPRMPCQIREPSAVEFKGRVLVYGLRDANTSTYVLMAYEPGDGKTASSSVGPAPGKWHLVRRDKLSGSSGTGVFKPVLTVHDGKCYRVVYEAIQTQDAAANKRNDDNVKRKARVAEMVFDFKAEVPSATIAAEETQNEELMRRVFGTVNFCIQDRLFVNACGLVYDTGLTAQDMESKRVDEHLWVNVIKQSDIYGASVVLHTYEDS